MVRASRRPLAASSAAIVPLALAAAGIAASPNGGCGTAFTWATIAEVRELRPAMPPGVAESVDLNGNGALCYREMAVPNFASPNHGHLNLVDDRGPDHG